MNQGTPMRKRGYSLHNVILIAFLACMGILLLFVLFTLVPRVNQLLEQNAVERTRETVLQSTSTLDVYVNSMISVMNFVSQPLTRGDAASEDTLRLERLNLMQQSRTDIVTLAFFNGDGSLRYGTGGKLRTEPEEIRKRQWFQNALSWQGTSISFSRPHVQELFSDQRSYVITLARGLEYEENGERTLGVLLMDVNYSTLSDMMNGISLGSSGYVYLLDEQDRLLVHPRLDLINQGLAEESIAAVHEKIVGVTRDRQNGRDRILMISTVGQTRWRLVGVAYADELLALQDAFIRILTVVFSCAGLLSLAAATLMAFWVTRPITHLEHKMQKVQTGDLNVTITEKGFREIRSVSAAFNHMLAQIRSLMDKVVEEQETKRLHELNALQAQINPHFLYNTLDSIVWMEERGRSREAITMVLALAKLFRISISKGRRFITVEEELEHVRNYLIIQKMRFKEKFTYEITRQPEALCEHTVKLIIQPLVENCINHAIDEASGEELHIVIDVSVTEAELIFTVTDDGIGISEERLPSILTTSVGESGIGLKNVNERIQLTYGPQYGLSIQSVEDEGTTITVRIPRGWEESK
ncbi:MAG: sensor histidine kinase [Eubacteriales bacterium]|nr:sensor histidine kinase [Eubacteriales bacterium]